MKHVFLAAIAASTVLASPVSAAVITFEALGTNTNPTVLSAAATRTEAGFNLQYTPGSGGFAFIGGQTQANFTTNGTVVFRSFNSGSLTLTTANGGLFSLSSFDAAQTVTGQGRALSLLVTGVTGAGTVSQTFTSASGAAESFRTFNPVLFANVSSLTFTGTGSYPNTEFAVDNVNAIASAGVAPACCVCCPTTDIGFHFGTWRLQYAM